MAESPETPDIVTQAQRVIAARKHENANHRWPQRWNWLLPACVGAVMVVFLGAPGSLPHKLLLAMGGVCGVRPEHSYAPGGVQLPLEARDVGMYSGFLLTFGLLGAMGRINTPHRRIGSRTTIIILGVFLCSMVGDGINSTLAEVGLPHLYRPTNSLRLITGLLWGSAMAVVVAWLFGRIALYRQASVPQMLVTSSWELLVPVALCGVVAGVVFVGVSSAFYPLALLSVSGLVALLAITLLLLLRVAGLVATASRYSELLAPGSLALLLVFAVLGSTAWYRWTHIGAMP